MNKLNGVNFKGLKDSKAAMTSVSDRALYGNPKDRDVLKASGQTSH